MKKSILTLALMSLIPAASFAAGSSLCERVQIEGKYSASSPAERETMYEGFRAHPPTLIPQKTPDGYEFAAIEATIPTRLGEKIGSFGTLSLQADASAPFCIAKLTRSQGSESYRIAMAPNGDLILSQLSTVASDGSVVPAMILYKLAQ